MDAGVELCGNNMTFSGAEVAKHNSRQSCWIVVHGAFVYLVCSIRSKVKLQGLVAGKVYDVTEFLDGMWLCPVNDSQTLTMSAQTTLVSTVSAKDEAYSLTY